MPSPTSPQKLSDLLAAKQPEKIKAPAYEWQDFALRLIAELGAPPFKRGSIFKICKDQPKMLVERALNETKELCKSGQKWKYFFKVIDSYAAKYDETKQPE